MKRILCVTCGILMLASSAVAEETCANGKGIFYHLPVGLERVLTFAPCKDEYERGSYASGQKVALHIY